MLFFDVSRAFDRVGVLYDPVIYDNHGAPNDLGAHKNAGLDDEMVCAVALRRSLHQSEIAVQPAAPLHKLDDLFPAFPDAVVDV